MKERFGTFLADGSQAISILEKELLPNLEKNNEVIFDMEGVENMTDSFGNALIANAVKINEESFFKHVKFSKCSDTMKTLIKIAIDFGKHLKSKW